ncbi:hypothetical protein LOZ65_002197 [Ophidiomyces ophidiicola]|nr:hypothetical protein LOZ65_002197 [Ophidiomyces ophidiicola]
MALQAPSLLAHLPRPLGVGTPKCQFSEIYSLTGGKKRKRYEVAAAVDGESINIYSVQFPKLISSYAIPPQSSVSCPPCSVREKTKETSAVKRHTYCAMDRPDRQIICFVEEFPACDRSLAKFSTITFPLEGSNSPVVYMTIAPTQQQETFGVIVIHRDGRIRRLSSDLKTERWSILPDAIKLSGEFEVHAGFAVGFDEAEKTLFQKRQDLTALILGDRHGFRSDTSTILMLVMHPRQVKTILPSEASIHIFSIPSINSADGFAVIGQQHLRHVMTVKLPDLQGQIPLNARNITWSANLSQSELSVSFDRGYVSYNISHYSPEIDSHMIMDNAAFSSIIRVSSRTIMGASHSMVSIYDSKYQSLQADFSLRDIPQVTFLRQGEAAPSMQFVTQFSKLGAVIAFYGNSLLNFDLLTVQSWGERSRKRQRTSLLIDSIGKGFHLDDNESKRPVLDESSLQFMKPVGITQKDIASKWADLKSELESAAEANNTTQFDKLMKSKFWKSLKQGAEEKPKGFPPAREYIDLERIEFLLSKIFAFRTADDAEPHKLMVHFLPYETLQWLVNSRHLTLSNLRAALRNSTPNRIPHAIPDGSLVEALAHVGRSIKLLLLVLRSSMQLNSTELAHSLKILLDTARSHSTNHTDPPKALTESPQKRTPSCSKEAALADTSKKARGSEVVLTDAVCGLNLALIKLHDIPLDAVTQSIRSVLPNSDILSIIHHLRHSLATGGYTSPFTEDPPPSFASPKIPLLSLSIIVDLLNACIDAIGPSGWISAAGFSGEESGASLIADMKSEISAALAGVEEATHLKGTLREYIRCCMTAKDEPLFKKNKSTKHGNQEQQSSDTSRPRVKRRERVNGAEILVYDDIADPSRLPHTDTKMLPLSLKMTTNGQDGETGEVSGKTKVLKSTGEVRNRSKRELGLLKSKSVGQYSFERIII